MSQSEKWSLWENGVVLSFDFVVDDLKNYYSETSPQGAYEVMKNYLLKYANERLLQCGKTRELIEVMKINPFKNPPAYEKLIGNLAGYYSRRINIQHRIIYQVFEEQHIYDVYTDA